MRYVPLSDTDKRILEETEIKWEQIRNKTILISGMTGLIGASLAKDLFYLSERFDLEIRIVGLVRSYEKSKTIFDETMLCSPLFRLIEQDVNQIVTEEFPIDYIIHTAGPTRSTYFMNSPVETMLSIVNGTKNMLALAQRNNAKLIFLSTMEVYGVPKKGIRVREEQIGAFNSLDARNSYPIGKIAAENLCYAYSIEYGVDTRIVRLTQTFGPGVDYMDTRVFGEFARCAVEGRDIILKTAGLTERSYLYTTDAVCAILHVMLFGEKGEAYTVANEKTYCSIMNMANMVAKKYNIGVKVQEEDIQKYGYANTLYMDLDTSKIKTLGWEPRVDLEQMFDLTIQAMSNGGRNG